LGSQKKKRRQVNNPSKLRSASSVCLLAEGTTQNIGDADTQ
jgi:hypothetical protein